MSTRGLVGFKKDNKMQGWYNHSDSYYSWLGMKVLSKYKQHANDELVSFFNNVIFVEDDREDLFYENHKVIFDEDWSKQEVRMLQDGSEFINDGLFCEYAYVFDLDSDTIDVYRGFFETPMYENQIGYETHEDITYYVNKVLTINRDNINIVEQLFVNEQEINEVYSKIDYWEQHYIKAMETIMK